MKNEACKIETNYFIKKGERKKREREKKKCVQVITNKSRTRIKIYVSIFYD
jgi:hypothetical protein